MMNAKKFFLKGFIWGISSDIAVKFMQFLVNIVLARILFPSDFAIIAIAYLYINFINFFQGAGLLEDLIQRKNADDSIIANINNFVILAGFILFIFSWLIAPLIAVFFKAPPLILAIRLLSTTFIFSSFGAVNKTLLIKDIKFKKIGLIEFSGALIFSIVSITLGLLKQGVMSIVIAYVISNLVVSGVYYFANPKRLQLAFNFNNLKDSFAFGRDIIGLKIILYLSNNFDYFFIMKVLSPAALGFYYIAYESSHFLYSRFTNVYSNILFPILSNHYSEGDLKQYVFKTIRISLLFIVPLFFTLILFSREFIILLFGKKWLLADLPFKILCIRGMVKFSSSILFRPFFLSVRKIDLLLKWNAIALILYPPAILFSARFGISAVALMMTVLSIFTTAGLFFVLTRHIKLSLKDIILNINCKQIILSIVPIFTFCIILKSIIFNNQFSFLFGVLLIVIIYRAILFLTGINIKDEIRSIFIGENV